MRDEILNHIDDAKQLEKLYRDNKSNFKREFNQLYPQLNDKPLAQFWNERLNFEKAEISWGSPNELIFIIISSLIAGLIAKIPDLTSVRDDFFYPRNIGFIIFPALTVYFAWKNKLSIKKIIMVSVITFTALIFINVLPQNYESNTLILTCIHLPLVLWSLLGLSFVGNSFGNLQKRLDFLRYNGDLVVITTLILIAGMIMTGITIGLFSLIGFSIESFYFDYVVVFGLSAAPIVGTYVVQTNPQLVNKVSPVIAKLFSPLVLLTLVIYLIAIFFAKKDPYNDREFLLTFNFLLIGVMAIILFSVAGTSRSEKSRASLVLLFSLSLVSAIVNTIALSAILFRISEWGMTPNRLAVLGGNILILINLLIVTYQLFLSIKQSDKIESVERSIAWYLPIYSSWTLIVTFVFPFIFGFS